MPVTPFHFGPGLLGKAIARSHYSFTAFVASQVVIDSEPLYHYLRHESPLHGPLHTLAIGTPVGIAAGALVHVVGRIAALRSTNAMRAMARWHELDLVPALVGGAIGGSSHSLLDSLMHPDVHPFWPWIAGNPLLGLVGTPVLHLACIAAGIVAIGLLRIRADPPRAR